MGKLRSEADVQNAAREHIQAVGGRLWRNNVGAFKNDKGRVVRYGLLNDSSALNSQVKSSDLIGITPRRITPLMIGSTVGVFTAVECKRPQWRFTGTGREAAQSRFLHFVQSLGGVAYFTNGSEYFMPNRDPFDSGVEL